MNYFCVEDEYNRLGKRNIKNTTKCTYNCGGYALESFSWYLPRLNGDDVCRADGTTIEDCVKAMEEDFPNLRRIQEISELKENEYAVAFRLSDYDFHYIKRARNGHWYHKMGCLHYINTMKEEVVFSESWGRGYDGEIALLAITRQSLTTIVLLDVVRLIIFLDIFIIPCYN